MAITKFDPTDFTNKKISELSNTPNVDGMSANDLKSRFDAMPQQIADLLNTRLIEILNSTTDGSSGADNIASTTIEGIVGTTVQAIMESLASAISGHTTDISGLVKSVTYDSATGTFTITKFDNTYTTIDTPLEKVVVNFRYDQATESLILTYPDGTTTSISLSSFISEYDFLDSTSIKFTVSNHKVTANLDQSYYDTLEGFKDSASASATNASTYATNALGYKNDAYGYKNDASNSADSASASATSASSSSTTANTKKLEAEGWAVGKQNGEDVGTTSPYYHNNAKYYKDQAQAIVGQKVDSFNGRTGIVVPQSGDYTADMVGASAKSVSYSGTLDADSWSSNQQTISISGLATSGYVYIVSPKDTDTEKWAEAQIYALDVTTANQITFKCVNTPSEDIDLTILKVQVA